MLTNDLLEKILKIMPDAIIEEDGAGMLNISTYLTPCDSCELLINSEIHAEELGLCLDCSDAYFDTDN